MPNKLVRQILLKENVGFFFNVSQDEGLPVSLMEAQSISIPCVVTNVGGNSEIVNEKNGIILDKNITTNDLIRVFNLLTKMSDDVYSQKCAHSLQNWSELFNSEKNYLNWVESIIS